MKYHKLRIAFSAMCGSLCLLLIALWVRSYNRLDTLIEWQGHSIVAVEGKLLVDGRYSAAYTSPFFLGGFPVKPVGAVATAPVWIFVLLAASAAIAPWINWRFSLRTLLIAKTLVAVVLGLIFATAT